MNLKVFRLLERHQKLDARLQLEQARRYPDTRRIRDLKKLKLRLKDTLHALTAPRGLQLR